jgi:hypothetical protein
MKEEFTKYLISIGMTKTFDPRVQTIYEYYKEICPDEITDIFVTEYIKEDASREYENLWFFSSKYCMEAKLFITKDDFDMTPISNRITYWKVEKQDYDFKRATDKSRLNLELAFEAGIRGHLKASRENCNHLKDIILKHAVPNMKK